ncbi:hypothetical protein GCM10022254_28750 [Actinomadura meridiana]|uniref:Uncharacterized protein n=1 Tax=Actinomadura meridiana TaxID=559626 RepID=A0ABP8C0B8_9ACTN
MLSSSSHAWELAREELDAYACESHRRAVEAWQNGDFAREVAWPGQWDETVRPVVPQGGSSPEGRAASRSEASAVGRESAAVVGDDPLLMLTAIIPATRKVLERGGLVLGDIDLFEVNEAFAPVVLAWRREIGADLARSMFAVARSRSAIRSGPAVRGS